MKTIPKRYSEPWAGAPAFPAGRTTLKYLKHPLVAAPAEETGRYSRDHYVHPHFTEHKPGMLPQKSEGKSLQKKTQFTLSMNNPNAWYYLQNHNLLEYCTGDSLIPTVHSCYIPAARFPM